MHLQNRKGEEIKNMDTKKIADLMGDVFRTYKVLNPDSAELQNLMDIAIWFEDGYITEEESHFLKGLNKQIRMMTI